MTLAYRINAALGNLSDREIRTHTLLNGLGLTVTQIYAEPRAQLAARIANRYAREPNHPEVIKLLQHVNDMDVVDEWFGWPQQELTFKWASYSS